MMEYFLPFESLFMAAIHVQSNYCPGPFYLKEETNKDTKTEKVKVKVANLTK